MGSFPATSKPFSGFPFPLRRRLLSSPPAYLMVTSFSTCRHPPRTQSFCHCLATLPFTSQPLFTSFSLSSPALPLSLSSLINGVAGLWAAHPQQGVVSHCELSLIIVCLFIYFFSCFLLQLAPLLWHATEKSSLKLRPLHSGSRGETRTDRRTLWKSLKIFYLMLQRRNTDLHMAEHTVCNAHLTLWGSLKPPPWGFFFFFFLVHLPPSPHFLSQCFLGLFKPQQEMGQDVISLEVF